jgi:2-isopropylmalate synthase
MLPDGITHAVNDVTVLLRTVVPGGVPLGIHVHNDGGLAVANTLAAVAAGCTQVQGTINGIGERCGNVDLTTVIANLELKLKRRALPEGHLSRVTDVSRFVWERLNLVAPLNQAYVGKSAFAHKGGIHVSAMQRNERTYEHVTPESVGNTRQILISEMSGRSNVLAKLSSRYPELSETPMLSAILTEIQNRENEGYSYEAADASFELLVKRKLGEWQPVFDLSHYRVHGIGAVAQESHRVEATVKLQVRGEPQLCAAEGNGPVDALSHALLKALRLAYPELQGLQLVDYKVRVVNSADGTAAKVRVLIEHVFGERRFATLGVSENIIEASWQALVDAVEYAVRCDESAPTSERPSRALLELSAESGRLLV